MDPTHLPLDRIYIEVTNRCNLDCRTCMRNAWDEDLGRMDFDLFSTIGHQFVALSRSSSLFIGGIGEPLSHPDIVEMITLAKRVGCRVELITNGILLSEGMDLALLSAGLDTLWVSLDGARPESYSDVRLGDHLPAILTNLRRWQGLAAMRSDSAPELGISFVAMKRNRADLPRLIELAYELGVKRFSLSNVEPYTEALTSERLYPLSISQDIPPGGAALPRFDPGALEPKWLESISRHFGQPSPDRLPQGGACPFHLRRSLAVRWDGQVSPCLPLLHSHSVHFSHHERPWPAHHLGSLATQSLAEIWNAPQTQDLRQRVDPFSFAPCLSCNGCDLPSINGEDCFGNTHPACGGCLWAQGFIVCP